MEFKSTMARNQIDLHVGERVKSNRVLRKIDVANLASMIGVTPDQMKKYEAGASRITASRLQQIAAALDVNIACFFDSVPGSSVVELFPSGAPDDEGVGVVATLAADALELNRVFAKVSDPLARKKIIDLARSLADADAETSTSGV
jgi:transcriptional regulator with XRE-family HTH domain